MINYWFREWFIRQFFRIKISFSRQNVLIQFPQFPNLVYKKTNFKTNQCKNQILKEVQSAKTTGEDSLKWHYDFEKSRPLAYDCC